MLIVFLCFSLPPGYESLHSTPKQATASQSSHGVSVKDAHSCDSSASKTPGELNRSVLSKKYKDANMQTVDMDDSNIDTDDQSVTSCENTVSVKWTDDIKCRLKKCTLVRKLAFCSRVNDDDDTCPGKNCTHDIKSNNKHTSPSSCNFNAVTDDEDVDVEDTSSVKHFDNSSVASDFEPRIEWNKKMDFLLSIIGFAVDLANVSELADVCWLFQCFFHPTGLAIPLPML